MAKGKTKTTFTCQNCGAQRARWEGKCSDCGAWNSYVEEITMPESVSRGWALGSSSAKGAAASTSTVTLDQRLDEVQFERMSTGYGELNRVLGGGLVQGSFVLLGGSPGIGKSTLLLQMAGGLASHKKKVLYISSEESVAQTGSRAQRLGVRSPLIVIGSESNLTLIMEMARHKRPDVLVVDSIQTIFLPELQAAPGSVSQVRECAGHLMALAKNEQITVLLIGHVTKEGSLAGPKVLEHMVDCVLSFDGDMSYQFRLLRALKNRFGPTNELGVFTMATEGLTEVSNPSELFLEERGQKLVGSSVFASMEGTRPLLCEVQALTLSTQMAMPRRTSLGIDHNRLHMLAAVIDRHLGIHLNQSDIFVNVVGGLKLVEPASDLAVVAAIISSELDRQLDAKTCFFGEVGLTGEVRAVSFADSRIKEAEKLGFTRFVAPQSNKKHLSEISKKTLNQVTCIKNLRELEELIR